MFLISGVATAIVGPFLSLFLSTAVEAGPVKVTAFLVLAPLSGVAASWAIGRVSDSRPIRRTLLIVAALAGCAGAGLTAVVRDYWVLLAVTVTATAIAGAFYPQSFAYARQVLQRDDPNRAAMGISTLRTVFSIAWVGGPPLATVLLGAGSFGYVYGSAAILYALAALAAFLWLPEVPAPAAADGHGGPAPAAPRAMLIIIAGFTVLTTTMVLGVQALSLYVTEDLNGSVRDAGLLLGLCAALEIPLMLGFGALSTRLPIRWIILGGAACAIAYHVMTVSAGAVWVLAVAQIFNAVFIAATSGLGISYVQDMMPSHPGRATTMFTNAFPIGSMLAAPLFGVAQHFGYRWAYGINLGLAVLGLVLLLVARPPQPANRAPAAVPL